MRAETNESSSMKESLECGLKADGTRVFIAIESGSGYRKRESGGIQFNSDRQSSSTNRLLDSMTSAKKNIHLIREVILHPSPSLKNYPMERKCERMSIRPWFWP